MMEGMAASSSIAPPTSLSSQGGAISTRKRAMTSPRGTASSMAMAVERRVPKMVERAPNLWVTGFHDSSMRKPNPNALREGSEFSTSTQMMARSTTPTRLAHRNVTPLKRASSPGVRWFFAFTAILANPDRPLGPDLFPARGHRALPGILDQQVEALGDGDIVELEGGLPALAEAP